MPKKKYLAPIKNQSLSSEQSYKDLLQELKSILAKGQYAAYKAVDNIRVQTYWQLGERIVREEMNNQDCGAIFINFTNILIVLLTKQRCGC